MRVATSGLVKLLGFLPPSKQDMIRLFWRQRSNDIYLGSNPVRLIEEYL